MRGDGTDTWQMGPGGLFIVTLQTRPQSLFIRAHVLLNELCLDQNGEAINMHIGAAAETLSIGDKGDFLVVSSAKRSLPHVRAPVHVDGLTCIVSALDANNQNECQLY